MINKQPQRDESEEHRGHDAIQDGIGVDVTVLAQCTLWRDHFRRPTRGRLHRVQHHLDQVRVRVRVRVRVMVRVLMVCLP